MRPLLVLAAASVLALATGCARERPSVIVLSLESMRADQLEARFGDEPVAPILAGLANEGVLFEKAVSGAPWTTPSMMSVMTGHLPGEHGVEEHDRALASQIGTLAERFRAAGYRTAAMTPAVTLRGEYGFARGFEIYDNENFGHNLLSSPSLISKAQQRIENWRDEPFFIWVHLWDPHYNYIPEPAYQARFERGTQPANEDVQCLKWIKNPMSLDEAEYLKGKYQAEIRYTDDWVGRLLKTLEEQGLRDDVIIALVGDHGESFLEHEWLGHTAYVHDTNVRVPLALHWRGRLAPARIAEYVSTASLGRTLLRLVGLDDEGFGARPPLPMPMPGQADAAYDADAHAPVARTIRRNCLTSVHQGALKYTLDFRGCTEQLFDLDADPAEQIDVAASRPEDLARMRALLAARYEGYRGLNLPRASMPKEIVDEAQAQLRTLGYVGGGGADAGGDTSAVQCAPMTPLGRDTFGDIVVDEPCPAEDALACVAALGATR